MRARLTIVLQKDPTLFMYYVLQYYSTVPYLTMQSTYDVGTVSNITQEFLSSKHVLSKTGDSGVWKGIPIARKYCRRNLHPFEKILFWLLWDA
jgi:hypothetical protein